MKNINIKHIHTYLLPVIHAIFLSSIIIVLFYYWYQMSDRTEIFLYDHLGQGLFDKMTVGRYLMSGLVACGYMFCIYIPLLYSLKRLKSSLSVPSWLHVSLISSILLSLSVPFITLTGTEPHLPLSLTAGVLGIGIGGLWLTIFASHMLLGQGKEVFWVLIESWGVVPPLLLLHAIEISGMNLAVSPVFTYALAGGSVVFQMIWLSLTSYDRHIKGLNKPIWYRIYFMGVFLSYVILPLFHHLFFTPFNAKYIATASNFVSFNPFLQTGVFLIPAGITWGVIRYMPYLIKVMKTH